MRVLEHGRGASRRAGEPADPASSLWTTDNNSVLQLSSTYGAMVMVTARGIGSANLIATCGPEQTSRKIEVVEP